MSPRGIIALAVMLLALGGGWYYFTEHSPQSAIAMNPAMTAPKGAAPLRKGTASTTSARVVTAAPATMPAPIPRPPAPTRMIIEQVADPLGATYVDDEHGFTLRLPAAWSIRTFTADPWVLDSGDASSGMISVGFSPCPAEITADHLLPEGIARKIKKRAGTKLLGQGKTQIAGRKALWFKSTGPMPLTTGSPVMTRVQYIVPLGDGRLLELRVAATPQQFDVLGNVMKQSIDTFMIIPRSRKGQKITSR
jgi:hypothetical protein